MPVKQTCTCGATLDVPTRGGTVTCAACGQRVRYRPEEAAGGGVTSNDFDTHVDATGSPRGDSADAAFRCADCGAAFARSSLVMTNGELVCRACLRAGKEAGERQKKLILWLSASAAALLIGLALYLFVFNRIPPQATNLADAGKGAAPIAVKDGKLTPAPVDPGAGNPTPQPKPPPTDPPETIDDAGDPPSVPAVSRPQDDTLANYVDVSVIAVSPGTPVIATYRRNTATRPATDEIRLWDSSTGKPQRTIAQPHRADAMAISGDGRWLVSMGRAKTQAQLVAWDLADGSVRASMNIAESFGSVAFSSDHRYAWCLCPSDGMQRLDIQQRAFQRPFAVNPNSYLAQFSPVRQLAAVKVNRSAGGGAEQWIDVYDLSTKSHLTKLSPGGLIGSFALSPDGSTIALGYRDRIDLYETKRWQKKARIDRSGVNAPQRLLFSPDSVHLIELPFGVDGASPVVRDLKAGTHTKLETATCTDWGFGPGNRLFVASEKAAVQAFELGKP